MTGIRHVTGRRSRWRRLRILGPDDLAGACPDRTAAAASPPADDVRRCAPRQPL